MKLKIIRVYVFDVIILNDLMASSQKLSMSSPFYQNEVGWVGKMQLRKIPPFSDWSQEQWSEYCNRGPYFTDEPHFINPCDFAKLINTASQNGWELVAQTTNHNGICPAHLGSIAWMQDTRLHFIVPNYCMVIQIRYTETCDASIDTPVHDLKPRTYFELQCYVEFSDDAEEYLGPLGEWNVNGGSYCNERSNMSYVFEGYDMRSSASPEANNSIDILFSDSFWKDCTKFLPNVKTGKITRFECDAGTYGLPGSQTEPQKILSEEFELKYLQKISQTKLAQYLTCFELYSACVINIDDKHVEIKEYTPIEIDLIPHATLTPTKLELIKRVWNYVKTGYVDPLGLHDCSKHATHCVIIGRSMAFPASADANNVLPWHDVFDMEGNFKNVK